MLYITVPELEVFDEASSTLLKSDGASLLLEHSLVSLSKWEAIWNKPFLDGKTKTTEETLSYIACMNLAPVPSESIYKRISQENIDQISEYIDSKQTATWFRPEPNPRASTEIITNEIIYYWMIAHNIPSEYQHWHLNKLLTLLKVCNEKNKPATKSRMGKRDMAAQRRMLNDQRRAELGTTG